MNEIKMAVSAMDGNLKTVIKTSAHSDINVLQAKAEKWEKATAQYINAPKYNNPGVIFGRSNWPPKKGRLCIWGIFFLRVPSGPIYLLFFILGCAIEIRCRMRAAC